MLVQCDPQHCAGYGRQVSVENRSPSLMLETLSVHHTSFCPLLVPFRSDHGVGELVGQVCVDRSLRHD